MHLVHSCAAWKRDFVWSCSKIYYIEFAARYSSVFRANATSRHILRSITRLIAFLFLDYWCHLEMYSGKIFVQRFVVQHSV